MLDVCWPLRDGGAQCAQLLSVAALSGSAPVFVAGAMGGVDGSPGTTGSCPMATGGLCDVDCM